MIEVLLIILAFIALSGFFAMIDAAVLNVTPAEVEVLIAKGRWGARQLKILLRHTTRAIIVIVIFTNVTNILGPILAARKAVELFGNEAIGFVTAFLTFATIVFAEIIPKSIGAHHAPRISRRVAPLLLALTFLLYPIVIVLERMVRMFKKSGSRKVGTEEQIRALANIGGGAGHIDADERELIHRAFVLNDRKVRDIMTPLDKTVTVSVHSTLLQAARMNMAHHYSRYPVAGDSLNDIRGYILSRDVLEAIANGRGDVSVSVLLRTLEAVDAAMTCDELLNLLRRQSIQLAIVKDHGTTAGLVTQQDVLEELVGEMKDEGDMV